MTGLRTGKRIVEGFTGLTLASPEEGGIEVAFVPSAGMVGCSLSHREGELLGQRGGLHTYVTERSTMGIPLLYPWANRLGERRFEVAGRTVDVDASSPTPNEDPNGLPIHGLLAAAHGWQVTRHEVTDDATTLAADFDFGAHRQIARGFPFPHELSIEATLSGGTLTIATTVRATGDATVPIAFGYHPYFRLPNVPRSDWEIELPVRERLRLDERMLPTGQRETIKVSSGPLGSRTFDDAYVAPDHSAPFTVSGGGRRIEVAFGSGYPYAQVYAPADDDVIALEPMTAPTNALVTDGPELPLVEPGSEFSATFSITITDTPD
jgi:aldose 1-epimerase